MTIQKTLNGSSLTIAVEGRLDTTTAPQLEASVNESIEDINDLKFDFANLEYISSAGLRVLLSTQKKMSKRGGMIIRNVNETLMEVFEITGFVDVMDIK